MPGFPVGLGGMFRGQMPFMQGIHARILIMFHVKKKPACKESD
jgi:hypothetical protein